MNELLLINKLFKLVIIFISITIIIHIINNYILMYNTHFKIKMEKSTTSKEINDQVYQMLPIFYSE